MRMNPSIILSGQTPDVMNALAQGAETANTINQVQWANALSNLYREQGAGIINGDQNALNALAGLDPQAALGVQESRLGMDATRLDMDVTRNSDRRADAELRILTAQEARQVEEHARTLQAEEAAAEVERMRQGVATALAAQTPEQFAQLGLNVPGLTFENREMFAARFMDIADVIEMTQGGSEFQADRYRNVGDQLVDLNPGGGRAPTPVDLGQGGAPERDFGAERDFTNDWNKLSQVQDFADRGTALETIRTAAQDDTGASDIALIFAYMKMLDPTSTVREGEFATAEQAGGLPAQIVGLYNRALNGQRLTPEVRNEFSDAASRQYEAAERQHLALRNQYLARASEQGMPESVVTEFGYRSPQAPQSAPVPPPRPQQAAPADEGAPAADIPPMPPNFPSHPTMQRLLQTNPTLSPEAMWPLLSPETRASILNGG